MKIINKTIFGLMILASCQFSLAGRQYPLLEKSINQQQYQKAYQVARKLRGENEGDPRFDYLYGLSALQTGHYNEAVFALDRVTVATPNVIRPRLELARAYLKLNNKTAAIKEFNDVLRLSPPPVVRQKVIAYMAELDNKEKGALQSVTKRLASLSIGYDDNMNFGSDNDEIDLPGFGSVLLNPSVVKQESAYTEAKFQLSHRKIKSRTKNTFIVTNLTHRKYFKNSDFDYTDVDLRAGLTLNKQRKQYQFIVRDRPIFLDGKLHSNTLGVDTIIRKGLQKGSVVSASLSMEKYDNKDISLSDRKRVLTGLRFDKQSSIIQHQFNLLLGKEWPDEKAGKQHSRDIVGLGYRAIHEWNEKNKSFLTLDYRHYKHQAAYPVFPAKRKDDRYIIKAVHEWQLSDKAALLFSARHINNKSNLDLYDAKRNEVSIGVRYEWE